MYEMQILFSKHISNFSVNNLSDIVDTLKFYRASFLTANPVGILFIDEYRNKYCLDRQSVKVLSELLYDKKLRVADLSDMMVECKI